MRVDHWGAAGPVRGRRNGTVVVEIKGAPVRLTGSLRWRPKAAARAERVDGDLKASIPLVGGKVEKAAEPAIRAAITKEQEIGIEWLG